jgi:phage baseplate assembly protein W
MDEAEIGYGNDILLRDLAGDLDLALEGMGVAGGDIDLARGEDNVIQALTLRLLVHQGELEALGWPRFGSRLHELIGQPLVPRTFLKLQAYAREAIEGDARVVKVLDTRIQILPSDRESVRLLADVQLIGADTPIRLSLNLSLGRP